MKKFNISKPRKYVKDGVEKTCWDNVGEMIEFERTDGTTSRIIKIPAISLEANVFEERPREEPRPAPKPATPKTETPAVDYPNEEINTDDIPF